jgi:pSer/pThr/pTyr-binding forkhead associated (FHA) protein
MPARLTAFLPDIAASCLVRSLAPLGIGRGAEAGFRIDHPSISRQHARLVWERDQWCLHDTDSKNGCFVDGVRVGQADLGEQRWFRLGDVLFEFSTISDQAADSFEGRLVEKRATSRFLVQGLDRQTSLPGMLSETVRATVELAECERGFLLLAEGGTLRVAASHALDPSALLSREFHGSVGAAQRALDSGEAVVLNDARTDPALGGRHSVLEGGLRTLVCRPLVAAGETLGLVYADSRRPGSLITSLDLDLLRVFAERAALWIAARRGMEELARLAPERPAWPDILQAQRLAAA